MNLPTPAIVPQRAVQPMPRWALLLLCLAYVLPGFVGRDPWKNADVAAFGYMQALAQGQTAWWNPLLGGVPPDTGGLLPYWLGAWAIVLVPEAVAGPAMAARLPFMLLAGLTLLATWWGVYYLARSARAQPVAFAFGGEAHPTDYARAMADGALLALVASLGLAQLSHETTSYLAQLACTALLFFAVAAMPYRRVAPACALAVGLPGLALSGAPTVAVLLGAGSLALVACAPEDEAGPRRGWLAALVATLAGTALLSWYAGLWGWRAELPAGKAWGSLGRLLVWFGWPAWPLALWTLWRWRLQLRDRVLHRHLLLPLGFVLVALAATLTSQPADRALLLALPGMAALAAFALPTLQRSMAALIDWFTLLFFSISAIAIWVIWVAMQTGVPAKPAANVAKLAIGFVPSFSALALAVALAASVGWIVLVWWRVARLRQPIWKSLVLPASGATLCWLLLTTLWLPLLDYARSYGPQVRAIQAQLGPAATSCLQTYGLSRAQVAAMRYHGGLDLAFSEQGCGWMLADLDEWLAHVPPELRAAWIAQATVARPTDKDDHILVLRRAPLEP